MISHANDDAGTPMDKAGGEAMTAWESFVFACLDVIIAAGYGLMILTILRILA